MLRNKLQRYSSASTTLLVLCVLGMFQGSIAQEFVWAPEFTVGSLIPEISALDQNGEERTFNDLTGENGILYMLSRSFNW